MSSSLRPAASLACILAAFVTITAHAQQPAPAVAVDVPVMKCENPGSAPLDKQGTQMTRFAKRVDEYKVCVNTYTASTGAKANEYATASRAYSDAANKAIDDYNTYITKLNETNKADKPGAQKNTTD